MDYRAAFDVMKDHIVHVHLKDGTSEAASQKKTLLGEGVVDMRRIVDRLDALGYPGHLTLECEMETVPPDVGLKRWSGIFAGM